MLHMGHVIGSVATSVSQFQNTGSVEKTFIKGRILYDVALEALSKPNIRFKWISNSAYLNGRSMRFATRSRTACFPKIEKSTARTKRCSTVTTIFALTRV